MTEVDTLLEGMLVDAHGDDEQLWALREGIEEGLDLPINVHVVGEPLSRIAVDYDGNPRRGLTARCLREDGTEHRVTFADTQLAPDAAALGLIPLALNDFGAWNPAEANWGEGDQPIDDWAQPIIASGPRPMFEMEQVLPGRNPDDLDSDPILAANDLKQASDTAAAQDILAHLIEADLRCLDAHAHLGNLHFQSSPDWAINHYEVGVRIGELSLGADFDGVLAWGLIDNRPFLRCTQGYGLCLWRLKRWEETEQVFERLLWMNPSDNQGIRFLLPDVRARSAWVDDED